MRVFEDLDPSKDDVVFVGYSSAEHGQCVVEQRRRRDIDPITGASAPSQSRQVYLDPTTNDFASPLAAMLRREAGGALPPIAPSELPEDLVTTSTPLTVRERIIEHPMSTGILGALLLGSGLALGRWAARGSLSNAGVYAAASARRMDDLERRIVAQVQSASRDRTREIDTFKREILSSLSTHASAGTVIGIEDRMADLGQQIKETKGQSQKDIDRVLGQIEASNRDRRTELHGFRSEIMGQLQSVDLGDMEDRLVHRMDTLENAFWGSTEKHSGGPSGEKTSANQSVRDTQVEPSEFEAFRTEVMDQLQRMEHAQKKQMVQATSPPKIDAASVAATAPIAPYMDETRLGQVLQAALEEVIVAKMGDLAGRAQIKAAAASQHSATTRSTGQAVADEIVQSAFTGAVPTLAADEAYTDIASDANEVRSEFYLRSGEEIPNARESLLAAHVLDCSRFTYQLHRLFAHYCPGRVSEVLKDSVAVPLYEMDQEVTHPDDPIDDRDVMRCLAAASVLTRGCVRYRILKSYKQEMGWEWTRAPPERKRDPVWMDIRAAVKDLALRHAKHRQLIRDRCEIPDWDTFAKLENCFDPLDLQAIQEPEFGVPRAIEVEHLVSDGSSSGLLIRYDAGLEEWRRHPSIFGR